MPTCTDTELADFTVFVEYVGQRLLTGQLLDSSHAARIQTAMQSTTKALYAIFKRTGALPTLRYRGYLFHLYLCGDILGRTVVRESDIETVE